VVKIAPHFTLCETVRGNIKKDLTARLRLMV